MQGTEGSSSHAVYGRLVLALHALPAVPRELRCVEESSLHNSLLGVSCRCWGDSVRADESPEPSLGLSRPVEALSSVLPEGGGRVRPYARPSGGLFGKANGLVSGPDCLLAPLLPVLSLAGEKHRLGL